MPTRTINLAIEDGGYITDDVGAYVGFYPSGGTNAAFGTDDPNYMSFSFPSSKVYANHSGPVNITWDIDLLVGGAWHNLYSGSAQMSKSNSDFSVSNVHIPDALKNALKSHAIEEIGIFQTTENRNIRGEAGTTATCTIDYTDNPDYTACGAPVVCTLDRTVSDSTAVLSWSGATAGTANAVTGYEVQRAESTNGSTWGSWSACPNGITTATSLSVEPPETYGNYYRYRVRTRGTAGANYYSAWKVCASTLRRDHAQLEGFTDSTLIAGETTVKALHMTELQDRVNTLREFYGLSAYAFSSIDARGIEGWTDHVKEIRAAIDEIGKTHDAWIDIPVNCPRADVIEQLRSVVLST